MAIPHMTFGSVELKTKGAIKNGLSRDTGKVGYTRHKMKTNITQHRKLKR